MTRSAVSELDLTERRQQAEASSRKHLRQLGGRQFGRLTIRPSTVDLAPRIIERQLRPVFRPVAVAPRPAPLPITALPLEPEYRNCPTCGGLFMPTCSTHRYCNADCQPGRLKRERPPLPVASAARIKAIVADVWGIAVEEMGQPGRPHRIAHPRQAAMVLTHRLLPGISLPMVGRLFRRDHTTVMHALWVTDDRMASSDPAAMAWAQMFRRAEALCREALGLCPHCGAKLTREHRCPDCHTERETAPQETPARQAA